MNIRSYRPTDLEEWRRMRTLLWPDQTPEDMSTWAGRKDAITLVAERENGRLGGFAEIGRRECAEGCESGPVAYLEGWWVDDDLRRQGVGGALIRAGEEWARAQGYQELASDVELHNGVSQEAHEHLGFEEVARAVLYRKPL